MSPYKALTIICDVLSFKSDNHSLKTTFQEKDIDWELIVKIASKHLVLPTLYCRLQHRELLHLIPNDLENYLQEITRLNYERNKKLLEEVKHLSSILKQNNINHVFLKGSAMLALGSYDNIAERMIGDIDILIDNKQLNLAFDVIKKEGYTPVKLTLESKYFDNKHLPRLIPEKFLLAVELHKNLLKKKSAYLKPDSVLSQMKTTTNGIYVPNSNHLLDHIIYNYQINDNGHYYGNFSLRSFYDAILALKQDKLISKKTNKYKKSFFIHGSALFKDFKISNKQIEALNKKWFTLRLDNNYINTLHYKVLKTLYTLKIITSRSLLFIKNSNYRRDIMKDRKRIYKLILNGKI